MNQSDYWEDDDNDVQAPIVARRDNFVTPQPVRNVAYPVAAVQPLATTPLVTEESTPVQRGAGLSLRGCLPVLFLALIAFGIAIASEFDPTVLGAGLVFCGFAGLYVWWRIHQDDHYHSAAGVADRANRRDNQLRRQALSDYMRMMGGRDD